MRSLTLLSPASEEPLTTDEAKLHLRIDVDDENDLIDALIASARSIAEKRMGRALMTQQWKLSLERFPECAIPIVLPIPPFVSVDSIVYVNEDGTEISMDDSLYKTYEDSMSRCVLHPIFGELWPSTRRCLDAVRITFTAGYANAQSVPDPIKSWMKIMIGTLYANREAVVSGATQASSFLPRTFCDGLLDPFVVPSIA